MNTWILLRGLTRESRHWGEFPALLRDALPGDAVHAVDLPGNGQRFRQRSPLKVAEMVESCRSEVSERGIAQPCHLLAMSLGAMVAIEWSARYPEEIGGAVLINTSLRPFDPLRQRLRPENYGRLLGCLLANGHAAARESTILRLTSRLAAQPDRILKAWVAYRREFPVSAANALRQLLAAARYRAPTARPATPLLVLVGGRDALVDPACSRRLAARWRTAFAEHPEAGHDLPLDDGRWVAAQVAAWQAALASSRR